METATLLWMVGQAIAIIVTLVTIYVNLMRALTRLQVGQELLERDSNEAKKSHFTLREQVAGISRQLERHEGALQNHGTEIDRLRKVQI